MRSEIFNFFLIFKLTTYCFTGMRDDFLTAGTAGSDTELELLFENIFKKYELLLYRLAYKVVKSDPSARDIVQNVFLKLWEHRDQIPVIHNPGAWLHRVTKNELIDFLRKTAADERLCTALWLKMQDSVKNTEEAVDLKDSNDTIQKAVSRMPPQRRLVYTLNRDHGLNYNEIAEELSISRHTVKNHLSLALRSIHRFLSGSISIMLIFLGWR